MANSVVKLSIDSHEFDANIKRAGEALNKFFDQAKKGDRTFEVIDDDAMEVVRAFGQMETKSKSASGQLAELTKGFTDLSLAYKRMTDEEKASPVGKEITNQLDILKGRIQDTKKDISDINGEINGGGGLTGALDQLAGKFGLNIQQLAGWGAAIGAAKVALDVAKDAFFQSESNIDEWGRTVEGAKGAYDVFLDTLNNGNWSNFFSNLTTAVQGARDLYDSLDRLGSIKSNNAAAIAIVQQEIAKLRLLKQSGEDVDAQIKDATARLAALQKQSVDAGKKAGRDSIGNIIRNEYNTQKGANPLSGGSISTAVNDILKNGQAAFDKYKQTFERLEKKAADTRVTAGSASATGVTSGTERYTNLEKLTDEERKQYFLAKAITEGETRIQQGIALYAQSVQEGTASAREEFKGNRYALTGSGGSGSGKTGGGGSTTTVAKELSPLQQAQKEISALTEEALTADEARRKVIKEEIADLQKQVEEYKKIQDYVTGKGTAAQVIEAKVNKPLTVDEMRAKAQADLEAQNTAVDSSIFSALLKDSVKSGVDVGNLLDSANLEIQAGIDVPDETWQGILEKYNELKAAIGEEPIQIDFNTGKIATDGKKAEDTWKNAASAVQSVGSAFSQIEDPGVKAMGTVMQAIASIALGYAQATVQASSMGPWAWIAFAASGLATMLATISSIHSATGYAEGGIVQGNSYSGDNVGPVMLDAGELILNRAAQGTLAEALTNGNNQGGAVGGTPYVTGEKIVMGINNYGRRAGLGELVFSR